MDKIRIALLVEHALPSISEADVDDRIVELIERLYGDLLEDALCASLEFQVLSDDDETAVLDDDLFPASLTPDESEQSFHKGCMAAL